MILTNADTTRSQCTAVTKDSILVQCDVAKVTELFNLVSCRYKTTLKQVIIWPLENEAQLDANLHTSQAKRAEIPENKVVLSSISHHLVALAHEIVSNCNSIGLHLLCIHLEARCHSLLQSNSKCSNLVVVRATLERWEHSKVDLVFIIIHSTLWLALLRGLRAFPVEDHASPWPSERLVCGSGNHITIFKRICSFLKWSKANSEIFLTPIIQLTKHLQ